MNLVLANPAGLWALLAVPAILAVHLLQRRGRTLPASTLFLLERLDRAAPEGRTLQRLRSSVPLWLQLLAAMLLAWVLSDPRRPGEDAVQHLVVVLDSSVSMTPFREEALRAADREILPLAGSGVRTVFTALESHPGGATLYRGDSAAQFRAALADWRPTRGSHSPEDALRLARSLAGAGGLVVFLTDHPEPPALFGASLLSVGRPLDNVGFAGLTVDNSGEEPVWEALVRNYSPSPQSRSWQITSPASAPGAPGLQRRLDLAAGETRLLRGTFPPEAQRLVLELEPDAFPLDDRLPLVRPEPKRLRLAAAGGPSAGELLSRVAASLENAAPAAPGEEPDLVLAAYDPLQPSPPPPVAVAFVHQSAVPLDFLDGPVFAANHPLVEGLNWQGLIARRTPSIPPEEGDLTLVWQGRRPLAALRESAGRRQLLLHFDLPTSNAERLPAFIVLLHRFAERVRGGLVAPERGNFELGQLLPLAFSDEPGAPPLLFSDGPEPRPVPLRAAAWLRAPMEPGFFEVSQGGEPLLTGAAHFADTREADFSRAGPASTLSESPRGIALRHSRPDPLRQLWLLALLAAPLPVQQSRGAPAGRTVRLNRNLAHPPRA